MAVAILVSKSHHRAGLPTVSACPDGLLPKLASRGQLANLIRAVSHERACVSGTLSQAPHRLRPFPRRALKPIVAAQAGVEPKQAKAILAALEDTTVSGEAQREDRGSISAGQPRHDRI